MPSNAALEDTLKAVNQVELAVRAQLKGVGPELEARSASTLAGVKFTDTEPLYGETYGQVFVSLNPLGPNSREVEAVVEGMRKAIEDMPSAGKKSFTMLAGGPPSGKPIAVKVRGDDFTEIQAAADAIKTMVRDIPGATDVQDDNLPGRPQLTLRMDSDALRSNHVNAALLARLVRLSVDGEVVAFTREAGDKIELRVIANESDYANPSSVSALLDMPIALPNGDVTRLGALVEPQTGPTRGLIKHYNLRRTITVEANLDKELTDTAKANDMLKVGWAGIQHDHPNISLDFSGELEDIEESLNAMKVLFLLGMGLVFLILAAQFASYFQPLMILVTVPLAFTGVAFGLTLSGNPLSLYTLYGVIALTGIAVNSAIVLIAAANDRLRLGRKTSHAIVQAARRRVVPILITTTTTIGGLFSLAFGLGGKSLLWGPVASSIVWGLAFSTVLTLFMVPLLYMAFMRGQQPAKRATLRQRARQVFSRMKP
jgi:multidrug efflux pump subunit AcrB